LLFSDLCSLFDVKYLDLFSGVTYELARGQGEFLSFKQHNLERGKVGEGWKGRGEGRGKWVEPVYLPTPHHPRFSSLFLRKSFIRGVCEVCKFRAWSLTSPTCRERRV